MSFWSTVKKIVTAPLTVPVDVVKGLFGGLKDDYLGITQTNATNEANKELAAATNQTNIDIARENNAMQMMMQRENNAFNRQQAIDMFNLEAEYNDPARQKERLLAAGLNPSLMYGGSIGASTGNVNAATPSAASSGITPVMPNLVTPQMMTPPAPASQIAALFGAAQSFGSTVSSLAKAGVDSATKKRIEALLEPELNEILAKTDNVKASTAFQEITNNFERLYGFAQRDYSLKQQIADIYRTTQDGLLASIKGETEKANKLFTKAQTRLTNLNIKKGKKELSFLDDQLKGQLRLVLEQIKTEGTKQNLNNASAANQNSQSLLNLANEKLSKENLKFLEDSHEDRVDAEFYKTEQFRVDLNKNLATYDDFVQKAYHDNLISYEQYQYWEQMKELFKKQNESYYGEMLMKFLTGLIPFAAGYKP